jgi:DNA-binding transcriptional LysR family regulator
MQAPLDWDDLRFLLAAAHGGSFASAARRLHVDQATVGRRLRALQSAVGVPLWERTPGHLSLTVAGKRVLRAAEQMDEAALRLERSVDASQPAVEGVLRIATTEAVASHLLAPRMQDLLRRHPALQVELMASNQVANLARREADLAIRLFRPGEPTLVTRRVGILAFGLYASDDYLRSRGRPRDARLEGYDLLGFERTVSEGLGPVRWLEGLAGRIVLRASSATAILSAAQSALGVGLLPCFIADRVPGLRRVVPELRSCEIWLTVHGELRASSRTRAGMHFLTDLFRRAGPLLQGRG